MDELKEFLAQFGKVERCEMVDDEIAIKITKGWDNGNASWKNMQLIVDKIEEVTDKEYTYIRETTMDKDLFQTIFYQDSKNVLTYTKPKLSFDEEEQKEKKAGVHSNEKQNSKGNVNFRNPESE